MDDPAQDDAAGSDLLISEDLVQSPAHVQAQTGAIDFDGSLHPPLSLHQDLSDGNGGQAWPAGMVLTRYLLRSKREALRDSSMSVSLISGLAQLVLTTSSG